MAALAIADSTVDQQVHAPDLPDVPESPADPFDLVDHRELAGGRLEIRRWEGERMLRIWTPPGYERDRAPPGGHPVLYLNDGQNLFDATLSMSGQSWRAAETAAEAMAAGNVLPFLIVGIDHAGALRSYDYCPYKPSTGPGGVRKDAADWPGGGVDDYLQRVVSEIVPFICEGYNGSANPALNGFGGSSFGGICALRAATMLPNRFGAILVESPSLWISDERFLNELLSYVGAWPQRTYLAMGTKEYSGIRPDDRAEPEFDARLAEYVPTLAKHLDSALGCGEARLLWEVEEGATHTEAAWADRLPRALRFLASAWWVPIAAARAGSLYFTSPRRMTAGQPALLMFNKALSTPLAATPGPPHIAAGFNNWQAGVVHAAMRPAALPRSEGADWWVVALDVPSDAYELQAAFSDGGDIWDNNTGHNWYLRVRAPGAPGSNAPVQQLAQRAAVRLYFTSPETLQAGQPAQLFMNRPRSGLSGSPNIKLHMGFNAWEVGPTQLDLRPTSLWRGDGVDWWASEAFEVPASATELNFAFTDGQGAWDSNDGHNYMAPVRGASAWGSKARHVASVESFEHGAGRLEILTLSKRQGTDKASSQSRWTEEKRLRVWLPPGYDRERPPPGGWPMLVMNDGQNLFEDQWAHQGVSWRLGYTASELVTSGQVPPFIICAIDSVGPMRSLNYLPFPPGTGAGGFRGDCERWPGGGLDAYMHRVVDEIMPLVTQCYGAARDPERVAFGGGSFAGVCALYAAMQYPHVFGAVLAESPSLWVGEGRFLGDMRAHVGQLPERIFIGCGTKEYSATRDHDRPDIDELLLSYYHEAASILQVCHPRQEKGLRGAQRLRFLVEEDAGHHELAWQWRLTGALQFLLSPWWGA